MSATDVQETPRPVTQLRESVKELAHDSVELIRQTGEATKGNIKKPTATAAIAGAAAMGALLTFGFVPTALAGGAAYVGYRLLRKRRADQPAS